MQTDITSLAPETLARIFELGAENEAAKAPFLLATSLVCRAWRNDSQARLWRGIVFVATNISDAPTSNVGVVDSPALGRFVTISATFRGPLLAGPWFLPAEISRTILSLRGLRTLCLYCNETIPASIFISPSLSDLACISISIAKVLDFLEVTSVPFSLNMIHLFSTIDAPFFVKSILATSRPQWMTAWLKEGSEDHRALMEALPASSSDLETVNAGCDWNAEVYTAFPVLRKLAFNGLPKPKTFEKIFLNLPSPFLHLLIFTGRGQSDRESRHQIFEYILKYLAKPVLGSLKALHLHGDQEDQAWLAGKGFNKECEARGIKLLWQVI